MNKNESGYCPTIDQEKSINIDYLDASTLCEEIYIKNLFSCDFLEVCDNKNNCPIYKKAQYQIVTKKIPGN